MRLSFREKGTSRPLLLLLLSAACAAGGSGVLAQEQERVIRVEEAESLHTFVDGEIDQRYFELSGNVLIEMEDGESGTKHRISADYILFNRELGLLSARGNVAYDLVREGTAERFTGESLVFNTADWSGTFFAGESSRVQTLDERQITFHYSGRKIERFEDGSVVLTDGVISSSGLEEPYYRIEAGRITILRPGEWAVKDATFYLGRIPMIPLPFFFMPGDKFFLNPSFGFDATKGYFLQTSSYFLGKPPSSPGGGFSFMQYLDSDPSSYTLEREGLFLTRKPADGDEEQSSDYIKLIADYYTLLGGLLAAEGELESAGAWKDVSFFAGVSATRKIVEASGFGYTTLIEDGGSYEVQWQKPFLYGTPLPVRFGLDFSGSVPVAEAFTLSADLPFFSDPSMRSMFFPRKEGMQWKNFIDPDEVLEDDEEALTTMSQSLVLKSRSPLPLFGTEKTTFNLDRLEVRSSYGSAKDPGTDLYSLDYYYPDTLILPDLSFSVNAVLFDTFTASRREDPAEEPPGIPPPPWNGSGVGSGGGDEPGPEERYVPPPALTPPDTGAGADRGSAFFRNSLGLRIQPKITGQNVFNTLGRASPETVSIERDYSFRRAGGSAALDYKAVLGEQFISFENKTHMSGTYQEHTVYSDAVSADFGDDSDDASSRYDITNSYSATLRPLLGYDLWKESTMVYEGSGLLLSGRWESDPEREFNTVPLSWSDSSITAHRLTSTLVRKLPPSTHRYSVAVQLPPKELYVQPELLFEGSLWQFSARELIRFPEESPIFEPVYLRFTVLPEEWLAFEEKLTFGMDTGTGDLSETSMKLSTFEDKLSTSHSVTVNLRENDLELYEGSVRLFPLHLDYTAKKEYDYQLLSGGWVIVEDDYAFRPYSISSGLVFELEPDPFWKRRINFTLSLDSAWEINLIRYSENRFTFELAMDLRIAEFLRLEFASVSSNTFTYRYFDSFSGGVPTLNIVSDLLDSFAFFDRERRERSNFNLESISIKAVHEMRDWDLNFVYEGKPVLRDDGGGFSSYRWQPEFSVFLQWRPIPEIKKEISYRDEQFEW